MIAALAVLLQAAVITSALAALLIACREAWWRLRQWRTRRKDHRAVREFIRHEIRAQRAQARYLEAGRRKSGRAA